MKAVKTATLINNIASVLLWLLGISVLVFNLLGMWVSWHLSGFGYYFYCPIPFVISIVALVISVCQKEFSIRIKYLLCNGIVLGISIIMTILTFDVFSAWFW